MQDRLHKITATEYKSYIGKCFKLRPDANSYYSDVIAFQILEINYNSWVELPSAICLTVINNSMVNKHGIITQKLHLWKYNSMAKMFKERFPKTYKEEKTLDCYEEISLKEFETIINREYKDKLLRRTEDEEV